MRYYDAKETGLRIKKLRKKSGLTQEELALELQINTDHLSKMERGGSGMSIDMAIALSTVLETSLDNLLLGKEDKRELLRENVFEIIKMLENFAKKL